MPPEDGKVHNLERRKEREPPSPGAALKEVRRVLQGQALECARRIIPRSSGELKVQWASSNPTIEPASSSSPRNLRADVSELPPSGGQRPTLQVSAHQAPGQ
ncbi:UNVERIFIED_CONTAM: hypothetical protein FKN15_046081 [Acipenser sinensis]